MADEKIEWVKIPVPSADEVTTEQFDKCQEILRGGDDR
jgi:hypothetical protein